MLRASILQGFMGLVRSRWLGLMMGMCGMRLWRLRMRWTGIDWRVILPWRKEIDICGRAIGLANARR